MSERFIFHDKTTFINKPTHTLIQDFQNEYITGDNSEKDKVNAEIVKLVEHIHKSKDVPTDTKDESIQALQDIAEQVKEGKANKLTVKGTLQAINEVVSNAADIAGPAVGIVASILGLLGLD